MTISQIEANVRYLINANGEKTDVIIPIELWTKLLEALHSESGLDPVDELESDSQFLANLETALRQVEPSQTGSVAKHAVCLSLPCRVISF